MIRKIVYTQNKNGKILGKVKNMIRVVFLNVYLIIYTQLSKK